MQPTIDIFGLSIKTFGLCLALAFLICGLLVGRRLKELGKPPDWAYEIIFAALVGGLVGARAYYVIQNYGQVKHDLLAGIFSGNGLVWYGGFAGGALCVLAWAWRRGMLSLTMADVCAPALALGYGLGRIGCQISGDGDYGAWCTHGGVAVTCPGSKLPWAMAYPHGTVPTPPGVRVQPTPIYETVSMGLVALALWSLRDRVRPGVIFALYLILSGLERLLVEFIRRNRHVALGLTVPQLESIAIVIVGGLWVALLMAKGGGPAALRVRPRAVAA